MAGLDSIDIETPWWRVVKKDGTIAIFDRDPRMGLEQKARLECESVPFSGDQVDMTKARWNEFSPID
jgi:alkylated DNA nucleotide flippase Atl1